MINVIKKVFGRFERAGAAKKRPVSTSSGRSKSSGNYPAVDLTPSLMCCTAAAKAMGKRVLFYEAPRLPLPACTMPDECTCKYLKFADRRDCERRLFASMETNRWFAGTEHRKGGDRRSPAP